MSIRGKPNVDAFLDGGAQEIKKSAPVAKVLKSTKKAVKADSVLAPVVQVESSGKRTKKLFELPEGLVADLEQRCVDERRQLGRRVTQIEIVERALGAYLQARI